MRVALVFEQTPLVQLRTQSDDLMNRDLHARQGCGYHSSNLVAQSSML